MCHYLTNFVEISYLSQMLRWENTAPPDGRKGHLDGKGEVNSQISRLAYVIKLIARDDEVRVYSTFERHTRRNDGRSYISRDPSWMNAPYELTSGWYCEGGANIKQKQDWIDSVKQLGLSPLFADCFDDFVEGKRIDKTIVSNIAVSDIEQPNFGEWRTTLTNREGYSRVRELGEAIARIKNVDVDKAVAAVAQASKENLKLWRSNAKVKAAIAEIRAERTAAHAAKAESSEELEIDLNLE